MNVTDFFSSNSYIYLPTVKNPKVALAVDNSTLAENAFNLYNPFSQKAKLLKKFSRSAFCNFNLVAKIVWGLKKEEKSDFLSYLEIKLGEPLVSSVYFSTINDKIVMQLQTTDAKIIGYLKYPLNYIGLQHLENEKQAIEILSENEVVGKYILYDEFNSKPFLLFDALEGEIGTIARNDLDDLLQKLKREEVYSLLAHPRILQLQKKVVSHDLSRYNHIIERVCHNSTLHYALVYEHGDFTPWNIIKTDGNYVPFDFEHFIKDGLEYFDLIKYYYQTGKLIQKMYGNDLVAYIQKEVDIPEILELLQLFLIKEIIRNKEENEPYDFEVKMFEAMEKQ